MALPQKRIEAIVMFVEGVLNQKQISEKLGVTERTVSVWLKQFRYENKQAIETYSTLKAQVLNMASDSKSSISEICFALNSLKIFKDTFLKK